MGPRGRGRSSGEPEETFTEVSDALRGVGTLHDIRIALVDNDTRLLFVAMYDGDWDQYIDDFATAVAAGNLRFLDELLGLWRATRVWRAPT